VRLLLELLPQSMLLVILEQLLLLVPLLLLLLLLALLPLVLLAPGRHPERCWRGRKEEQSSSWHCLEFLSPLD